MCCEVGDESPHALNLLSDGGASPRWKYQFPVASIERLTRLSLGLVLIRPNMTAEGVESGPAEWDVLQERRPHLLSEASRRPQLGSLRVTSGL